jgi:hypothetical protein
MRMRARAITVTMIFVALVIGGLCLPTSHSMTTSLTQSKSSVHRGVHLPKLPESLIGYSLPSTTVLTLPRIWMMTGRLDVVSSNGSLYKLSVASRVAVRPVATVPPTTPVAPTTTVPPVPVATTVTTTTTLAGYGEWTYEAATKVAICESSGWGHGTGGNYVGDLGISRQSWAAYGGGSDTSPAAQITVASRIQSYPPDQGGCGGGW